MYESLLLFPQNEGLNILLLLLMITICWFYLMKHQSEFFEINEVFRALVKTQQSVLIKCFRCDKGGEYTSNKFLELLALNITIQQISCNALKIILQFYNMFMV